MPDFSNDPHKEKSREIIGRADASDDVLVIQDQFIPILHRLLAEIALSEKLIITDPFILNSFSNEYEDFLKRILEPIYPNVKQIIFVISSKYNPVLFQNLKTHARTHKVRMKFVPKDIYHDRFWLSVSKDRIKGVYVGNSLTGVGKKYFFVGLLPDADALAAYQLLEPHL
jgi:hypothetical protein